eukprot:SM000363S13649  [mRNA]  locus=s363:35639:37385:- [translate_table: standard]
MLRPCWRGRGGACGALLQQDRVASDASHRGEGRLREERAQAAGKYDSPQEAACIRSSSGGVGRSSDSRSARVSLTTSEQGAELASLIEKGSVPLRPGVTEFIDEVLEAELPLAFLTAHSRLGEKLCRVVVSQLGEERLRRTEVIGDEQVQGSAYGQVVLGRGASAGIDETLAAQLASAMAAQKQSLAAEVAGVLKVGVELRSPGTMAHDIAVLRAASECLAVPIDRCIVMTATQAQVQAACQAGCCCIALRSSTTAQAEFPGAGMTAQDYGAGSLTLQRVLRKFGYSVLL